MQPWYKYMGAAYKQGACFVVMQYRGTWYQLPFATRDLHRYDTLLYLGLPVCKNWGVREITPYHAFGIIQHRIDYFGLLQKVN